MIANYHSHTFRCNHATGTEEEYIVRAIESGLKIWGFSDHSPYFFAGDYYSGFRMKREEFKGYCDTILALREKYKDSIDIKIGVEAEYYPAFFDKTLDFLKDYPVDYMIMGQHFLGNEENDHPSGKPTDDESILDRYVKQTMEALDRKVYTYFAHPDMFNFVGSDEVYYRHISKLCECALKNDTPLEINCLGIATNRSYPAERFWKIAGEVGNSAIIGCDAHDIVGVYRPDAVKTAENLAAKYNVKLLETVELRKVGR